MRTIQSTGLLVTLLLSSPLFAAKTPIASVAKIRGNVTKLLPGALEATVLEAGDQLPEDTSIVTGPKSFVKIVFIDKSELNMGPESKIVISEMNPNEQVGIISLLKGRIRTEVEKSQKPNSQNQNKFYIRTRTAALGVRGTDFQTIYNPENRMTSLLTYKGAVAMAKVDESTHQRFEVGETKVVRDDVTKAPELQKIPGKIVDEKMELKKVLASSDVVIVPPGQSSFSSQALKKSSLPVKISPVQLNALFKNTEFNEKNLVNLKSAQLDKAVEPVIAVAPQSAPADGLYNAKNGDFAPRAGGFIDEVTGLYVAPEAGSTFDSKNGVYVSDKSGEIDADTGQYVAPKGLVLDAQKGFVVEKNAEVKPELLALREDLNKSIARDVVVGDLDGEVVIAAKTLREKFIRDHVSLMLGMGGEKIKVNDRMDMDADKPYNFNVEWQIASTNRFAPLLGLSYGSTEFDDLSNRGFSQDSKAQFDMTVGLKYALTNRVDLVSKLVLDQSLYAVQTSMTPDVFKLNRIVITKINLGATAELMRSNHFSLNAEFFANMGFRKRFNDAVVSKISGFSFKLMPQYALDEKRSLAFGFVMENESAKVGTGLITNDIKREKRALELKYTMNL
ncbi:hypothetical protein C0V70_08650 [Bacteriovorax stolpii]|uniref:Uncharacterized protein n=1 Tax=Bacteriovorax stolpii TaxID=960 RepID=A0A2K9NTV5_BACTC|nr:FecR family protein [Bacteriovorax stolpii]AUN98174.1 hypothetical protein C0V70_08650 [Bacteriovorax stolpii]TDP52091.1 FecR family protein [Bacteriovorax stolpii]